MDDGPVNDNIRQDLLNTVGGDNVHHAHSLALKGHLYWYAYLTDDQKTKYSNFEGVSLLSGEAYSKQNLTDIGTIRCDSARGPTVIIFFLS